MSDTDMAQAQEQIGEKRTHQMRMEDINSKLSSKDDWYKFLEQNL